MNGYRGKDRGAEYEVEFVPGLEDFVIEELEAEADKGIRALRVFRPGFLRFHLIGSSKFLQTLRSAIAVYRIHRFAIPRPKALLGHQHFVRLLGELQARIQDWQLNEISLGIGAAGAASSVVRRLKHELAESLAICEAEDEKGELYLRLARGANKEGWEVLVRLTPAPLSKRAWRTVNVPGALNATVAHALARFCPYVGGERVLNLCSGSSTILIEHALLFPADKLIAIDNSWAMLQAARSHALASQTQDRMQLVLADVRQTPLPQHSVDRIYADLPFGHYVGSHQDNLDLYPAILQEADRIGTLDSHCIFLTHEVNLMRRCLRGSAWKCVSETRIVLSGLHPRIFVLKRKSA